MKKTAIIFVAILITASFTLVTIPKAKAYRPVIEKTLGLDRCNAVYMLIRETTWPPRGSQDMHLELLPIRSNAENIISLMLILPGKNHVLSLLLSVCIFHLAKLFSYEDGGDKQHIKDLYQEMIVPIKARMETI